MSGWIRPKSGFATNGGGGGGVAPKVIYKPFAFDDASPIDLTPFLAGDIALSAQIVYLTPFDDAAAVVQLGTTGTPGLLFGPTDTVPSDPPKTYNRQEPVQAAVGETMQLAIAPGASTQGDGYVLITIRRA